MSMTRILPALCEWDVRGGAPCTVWSGAEKIRKRVFYWRNDKRSIIGMHEMHLISGNRVVTLATR